MQKGETQRKLEAAISSGCHVTFTSENTDILKDIDEMLNNIPHISIFYIDINEASSCEDAAQIVASSTDSQMTPPLKGDAIFPSLSEHLLLLEATAKKHNDRYIIVIKGMENIQGFKNSHVFEAALRTAAQYSRNTNYVFVGGPDLTKQFFISTRPLYNMCVNINA